MENQEKLENSGFSPGVPITRRPVLGIIATMKRNDDVKAVEYFQKHTVNAAEHTVSVSWPYQSPKNKGNHDALGH